MISQIPPLDPNFVLPLSTLFGKSISLLLDDDANILHCAHSESSETESAALFLKSLRNVRKAFNLPLDLKISGIQPQSRYFQCFENFSIHEKVDNFYSNLPSLVMRIAPMGNGRFLGAVSATDAAPKLFEKSSGGLIYVDHEERLAGFSQSFIEIFQGATAHSSALLGRPLREVLRPTPEQFQEKLLSGYSPPPAREFNPAPQSPPLSWETGMGGAYVTLPKAVDLMKEDFCISFDVETDAGELPGIFLGDHALRGETFPDINGYFLGPAPSKKRMLFKKYGYVVASRPLPARAGAAVQCEVFKTGNIFCYRVAGETAFLYYDPDPLRRPPAFPILYLRTGANCKVTSLAAGFRPSPVPAASNSDMLVSLSGASDRFFLMTRFDSNFLTARESLFGYRLHDVSGFQERLQRLEAAYEKERRESESLKRLLSKNKTDPALVGGGKAMAAVREKAQRAADSAATVLLQGPTGSGKEVVAGFIHRRSVRSEAPFIKVDCSLLPVNLMESELFGHEKGAFTGADKTRPGLLEQADNGTLFLDELNNLSLEVQAKLLQFLQDRTVVRVGGRQPIKLNVRIIAASNADLKTLVNQGPFRGDLYFRLAVVTIDIPPLKERIDDLPALCEFFLTQLNRLHGKRVKGITPEAYRALYEHDWPGNVRELRNLLEQALVFCDGDEIENKHLNLIPSAGAGKPGNVKKRGLINLERDKVVALLRERGGVMLHAAEKLGVTSRALYYYLKKEGLTPNEFRRNPYRHPKGAR